MTNFVRNPPPLLDWIQEVVSGIDMLPDLHGRRASIVPEVKAKRIRPFRVVGIVLYARPFLLPGSLIKSNAKSAPRMA